jgi:hypothetical protein
MRKKNLLIAIAVLVTMLACTFPSVTNPTAAPPAPPVDTSVPPVAPPVEPPDTNVLFQDDFSSPDGPWDIYNTDYKTLDYYSGGFRLLVNDDQLDVWSEIHTDFPGDVSIEVDATTIGGPEDNDFGVLCRYDEDEENTLYSFYFFIISSDGFATIARMVDNQQVYMTDSGQMEPSSAILSGYATNHIRADCIGNTLTLYVNDQFVMSVQDTSLSGGSVGLIAGTFDEIGTDILFDNFVVTRP